MNVLVLIDNCCFIRFYSCCGSFDDAIFYRLTPEPTHAPAAANIPPENLSIPPADPQSPRWGTSQGECPPNRVTLLPGNLPKHSRTWSIPPADPQSPRWGTSQGECPPNRVTLLPGNLRPAPPPAGTLHPHLATPTNPPAAGPHQHHRRPPLINPPGGAPH